MKKLQNPIGLLRITFLSGFILLLLIGGIFFGVYRNVGLGGVFFVERENEFSRLLREYDFRYRRITETDSPAVQRQEFERLEQELDRLEKRAGGVESWLSVLKRRRQLAAYAHELGGTNSRYTESYQKASRRAARAFPHSEPIAAVAAAALVHDAPITREGEAELREMLPLLVNAPYTPMRLGLHVLLGDFRSPERAAANLLTGMGQPFGFVIPGLWQPRLSLTVGEAERITANLLILKILAGDISGAAADMQTALLAFPSPDLIRLAAEYYYDFGSLVRSAELFSLLPDEAALSRQADALWLAGYDESARAIWAMLTVSPVQNRALYNLALTAWTPEETAALLERLIGHTAARHDMNENASRLYGLIRFSRFFHAPQALAILDTERSGVLNFSDGIVNPAGILLELEMLKRRTEIDEAARVIAETWLLLDRYPLAADIYEWGLWYFELQRNRAESAMLLRTATRRNLDHWWMGLYEALRLIRENDPDAAEQILAGIPADTHWVLAANLGRVLEARPSAIRALESYERAIALIMEFDFDEDAASFRHHIPSRHTASRIQVRIAHCLRSLGRTGESRRALEYALALNEDNVNARLELNRLE